MEENFSNYFFDKSVDFDLYENLIYITTDNVLNNKTIIEQLLRASTFILVFNIMRKPNTSLDLKYYKPCYQDILEKSEVHCQG